jgi:hypothetical protein
MATNEKNLCTCTTPEYTIILNQQGPSGKQGATGQNGFSPIIDVSTNTRDTYVLTITTADGVITTPNLISEPIPSGGINGQVLTNFGNDVYGWGTLPNATTESQGVVYLSTDEDFQPDEEGNVNDTTACTPQTVVDYVQSVGLPIASTTTLGGIKVGDGLSITADGTLSAKTGIQYQALTQAEYDELGTKQPNVMYCTTDTNKVYLGTIPLTGGANAQYKTLLINNYDNATQRNLGGSTTVQVTDTEV